MGEHHYCDWDCGSTDCDAPIRIVTTPLSYIEEGRKQMVAITATQSDPLARAKDTVHYFAGRPLYGL